MALYAHAELTAGVSPATALADRLKQKRVRCYHCQVCSIIIAIIDIITAGENESHVTRRHVRHTSGRNTKNASVNNLPYKNNFLNTLLHVLLMCWLMIENDDVYGVLLL